MSPLFHDEIKKTYLKHLPFLKADHAKPAHQLKKYGSITLIAVSILMLSSCGDDNQNIAHQDSTQHTSNSHWQDISQTGLPNLNRHTNHISLSEKQEHLSEAQKVEERLINSYAKLAANQPDICPKLLQKTVDSNRIIRHQDIMVDNHCDYFIYPLKGQTLQVISPDRRIKTLLVTPISYDFANGAYTVKETDKHVIRLQYDSIQSKPKNFQYDVEVIIQ